MMKRISCVCILFLLIQVNGAQDENRTRSKRSYFLFPMGGLFKLVIGVTMPLELGSRQNMLYGLNFQFQYVEAHNYSQIQVYPPIISKSREKRKASYSDRSLFYLGLESLMNRHGIDGKSCILRSICENAMNNINHEANGLYGHLLHIMLTPDYGDGEIDPDLNPIYFEAEKAGKYGVDCVSLYSECLYENGILDFISVFYT